MDRNEQIAWLFWAYFNMALGIVVGYLIWGWKK